MIEDTTAGAQQAARNRPIRLPLHACPARSETGGTQGDR